jgi:hypothetical protein
MEPGESPGLGSGQQPGKGGKLGGTFAGEQKALPQDMEPPEAVASPEPIAPPVPVPAPLEPLTPAAPPTATGPLPLIPETPPTGGISPLPPLPPRVLASPSSTVPPHAPAVDQASAKTAIQRTLTTSHRRFAPKPTTTRVEHLLSAYAIRRRCRSRTQLVLGTGLDDRCPAFFRRSRPTPLASRHARRAAGTISRARTVRPTCPRGAAPPPAPARDRRVHAPRAAARAGARPPLAGR